MYSVRHTKNWQTIFTIFNVILNAFEFINWLDESKPCATFGSNFLWLICMHGFINVQCLRITNMQSFISTEINGIWFSSFIHDTLFVWNGWWLIKWIKSIQNYTNHRIELNKQSISTNERQPFVKYHDSRRKIFNNYWYNNNRAWYYFFRLVLFIWRLMLNYTFKGCVMIYVIHVFGLTKFINSNLKRELLTFQMLSIFSFNSV